MLKNKVRFDGNLVRQKIPSIISSIARIAFLCIVGYIVLYPLLYMFVSAIKDRNALLDMEHIWVPVSYSFKSFSDIYELMNFGSALKQTLLVQVLSALIEVFVCAFIAYGFARFKFKGKPIFTFLLILSLLIPIQMYSLSMSVNFRNLHIFSTPFVYWLPSLFGVGIRSGMMIFIYQQFFIGLPKELEDAAYIDGAGPVKTYFKIALPSSSVVLVTVSVLSFVWHWNEYHLATLSFLSEDAPLSMVMNFLTVYLQQIGVYKGWPEYSTLVSAACLMYIVIPLVLYMIFQRKFVRSIDRVGITG
ncbi:MAG: carbohydrate ABC transporter permease [Ruminococcaceae bacterium]|nr:carbohydrate ABC transporter permease [Oscillospiraceae bacterium]